MPRVQVLAIKAIKHWTKYLPEKTRELKALGLLEAEALAAANLAKAEIQTLMKQGFQEHEAEEVALPMFILLKPEKRE